jgi:hypothetical protein
MNSQPFEGACAQRPVPRTLKSTSASFYLVACVCNRPDAAERQNAYLVISQQKWNKWFDAAAALVGVKCGVQNVFK